MGRCTDADLPDTAAPVDLVPVFPALLECLAPYGRAHGHELVMTPE
jgi:hypothetical protein